MTEIKLKIFNSLNCSHCATPFDPNPNTGSKLLNCGKAFLCAKCYKEERDARPEFRKHKCAPQCIAQQAQPPEFLIWLFVNEYLKMNSDVNGYLLAKQLTMPACPICHLAYSAKDEARIPWYHYGAKHTMCSDCRTKLDNEKERWCPVCGQNLEIWYLDPKLIELFEELPEMIQQFEASQQQQKEEQSIEIEKKQALLWEDNNAADAKCDSCEKISSIDETFDCEDCGVKICGICTLLKHKDHQWICLLNKEKERLTKETRKVLQNQLSTYDTVTAVLHQDVKEKTDLIKNLLTERVEQISEQIGIEKTVKEAGKCRDFGQEFEEISEKYMPHLRLYDTDLQKLCEKIWEK